MPADSNATTQTERVSAGLLSQEPQIANTGAGVFLNFVNDYSGILRFWNGQGDPDGTWKPFFESNVSFVLADIGRARIDQCRDEQRQLKTRFRKASSDSEREEVITKLLWIDLELGCELVDWYTRIHGSVSDLDRDLEIMVVEIAKANLGQGLYGLWDTYRLMWRSFNRFPESIIGENIPGTIEKLRHTLPPLLPPKVPSGPAVDPSLAGYNVFWEYVDGLFENLFVTTSLVKKSIPEFLSVSLARSDHPPQIGLLLAFQRMFDEVRGELNGITRKHLDFFYCDILRQRHVPTRSDQHGSTLTQAAPKQTHGTPIQQVGSPMDVSEGSPRDAAGAGSASTPQRSGTSSESGGTTPGAAAHVAQPVALKTVYNGTLSSDPAVAVRGLVFSAPVANSADGHGAKLQNKPPSWPTFGEDLLSATGSAPATNIATLGFAVSSPALLMSDGEREVHVSFDLDRADLFALSARLKEFHLSPPPASGSGPSVPATGAPPAIPTTPPPKKRVLESRADREEKFAEDLAKLDQAVVTSTAQSLPALDGVVELALTFLSLQSQFESLTQPEPPPSAPGGPSAKQKVKPVETASLWNKAKSHLSDLPSIVVKHLEQRLKANKNLDKLLDKFVSAEEPAHAEPAAGSSSSQSGLLDQLAELTNNPTIEKIDEAAEALRHLNQGHDSVLSNALKKIEALVPGGKLLGHLASLDSKEESSVNSPPQLDELTKSLRPLTSSPTNFRVSSTNPEDAAQLLGFKQALNRIEGHLGTAIHGRLLVRPTTLPKVLPVLVSIRKTLGSDSLPARDSNPLEPAAHDGHPLEALAGQHDTVQEYLHDGLTSVHLAGEATKALDTHEAELGRQLTDHLANTRDQLAVSKGPLGSDASAALNRAAEVVKAVRFSPLQRVLAFIKRLIFRRSGRTASQKFLDEVATSKVLSARHADAIATADKLTSEIGSHREQIASQRKEFHRAATEVAQHIPRLSQNLRNVAASSEAAASSSPGRPIASGASVAPPKSLPIIEDAIKSLKERLVAAWDGEAETPEWGSIELLLDHCFQVAYSGPKGWVDLGDCKAFPYYVLPAAGSSASPKTGLAFPITIPVSKPPVTAAGVGTHGVVDINGSPLLRFELNQQLSVETVATGGSARKTRIVNPYPLLAPLGIDALQLRVGASQSSQFTTQDDFSVLKAHSPFTPFGINPVVGNHFYLGNSEVFRKKLRYVILDFEWFDLPDEPNGFSDYYSLYNDFLPKRPFHNGVFQWTAGILNGRQWHDISLTSNQFAVGGTITPSSGDDEESVPMFAWSPPDPNLLPIEPPGNGTGIMKLEFPVGKLKPSSSVTWRAPDDYTPGAPPPESITPAPLYSEDCENGFLRFTLAAPTYAFGKAEYSQVVAAVANANMEAIIQQVNPNHPDESLNPSDEKPSKPKPSKPKHDSLLKLIGEIAGAVSKVAGLVPIPQAQVAAKVGRLVHKDLDPSPGKVASKTASTTKRVPITPLCKPLLGPPPRPYVPRVKSVKMSYGADGQSVGSSPVLYHLEAFGISAPVPLQSATGSRPGLLPRYLDEGTLYLALDGIKCPQEVTLAPVLSEGSRNQSKTPPNLQWSYLKEGRWHAFASSTIQDCTSGFTHSGIVTLKLPDSAPVASPLFSGTKPHFWIRVTAPHHSDAVSETIKFADQLAPASGSNHVSASASHPATVAVTDDRKSGGKQTSASTTSKASAGSDSPSTSSKCSDPSGDDESFYLRVSERLRHKGRAVAAWDYERLVLQEFPEVRVVRCLQRTRFGVGRRPGHVTILIVPYLGSTTNPLAPAASHSLQKEVEQFLRERADPAIGLEVRSPVYLYLQVTAELRLPKSEDPAQMFAYLNRAIIQEIAPWSVAGSDANPFDVRMDFDSIREFIIAQSRAEGIQHLGLVLRPSPKTKSKGSHVPKGSSLIVPPDPWDVITSAPNHELTAEIQGGHAFSSSSSAAIKATKSEPTVAPHRTVPAAVSQRPARVLQQTTIGGNALFIGPTVGLDDFELSD